MRKETDVTGHSNSLYDPSVNGWLSLVTLTPDLIGQYWSRDLVLGSDWLRLVFWHWPVKVTRVQWRLQLNLGHPGEIFGKIATLQLLSAIIKKYLELLLRVPGTFFKHILSSKNITLFWLSTNDSYHSDWSHISITFCVSNCLSMCEAPSSNVGGNDF